MRESLHVHHRQSTPDARAEERRPGAARAPSDAFVSRRHPSRLMKTDRQPLVWALLGEKAGDNEQVLALVEALGLPFRVIRLHYNSFYRVPNPTLGDTLRSVAVADPELAPPWPDLVVAAGRRSVPVARWIRRSADGRVRLVQIGRPRATLDLFDLVLAPAQYRLHARDNVVRLTLPLVRAQAASDAASAWHDEIAALPRPRAAVLIGGPTRTLDLPASTIRQTVDVAALAVGPQGSLLITTSPRTPEDRVPELEAERPALLYSWRARVGLENPLDAFLLSADRVVVTGDSVSMLAKAVATGLPVTVVPARKRGVYRWLAAMPPNAFRLWQSLMHNAAVLTPPPDTEAPMETLAVNEDAAWVGGVLEVPSQKDRRQEILDHVRSRTLELLDK